MNPALVCGNFPVGESVHGREPPLRGTGARQAPGNAKHSRCGQDPGYRDGQPYVLHGVPRWCDGDRCCSNSTPRSESHPAKAVDCRARAVVVEFEDRANFALALPAMTPGGIDLHEALAPLDRRVL